MERRRREILSLSLAFAFSLLGNLKFARIRIEKMDHDKIGCQAPPEGPILCINNCGSFGSTATMNLCSKCHKDMILKEEQAKLVASSIGSIVNGSSISSGNEFAAPASAADVVFIPTR